jgi:cellulose synthase/poly-beta-1,6-N-acetylglucosamine synthase-like glycosyltransferase
MLFQWLVLGAYGLIFLCLAFYGFHRTYLLWLYYRYEKEDPKPENHFDSLPRVTVQLPFYNEKYVARRVIEAAARLEYPKDLLEIQVLDDSTDETTRICSKTVEDLRTQGFDISYIHRNDRSGYKAGALENGMKTAKGEFVAIFDADFIPQSDFLQKTIHFFTHPRIGLVQARWGHLNREHSALTRTQAMMLDGHFVIEQTARYRSERLFCFNGTAGVWRKQTLQDAGGWEHDTLTEDMDVSYRAQLKGWRFIYLKDLEVPSELPVDMNAFKTQQFRWAKGAMQCARKLLMPVLRSDLNWKQKAEVFYHLTDNIAYPLLLVLSVLLLPVLLLRSSHGWVEVVFVDLPLLFATTISVSTFYIHAEREEGSRKLWQTFKQLPLLLAVGIGLCISQTRAVLEALRGQISGFVRTPKHGVVGREKSWRKRTYRGAVSAVPILELVMAGYFAFTLVAAIYAGRWVSIPFILLFLVGFSYVGLFSLGHGARRSETKAVESATVPLGATESLDLATQTASTGRSSDAQSLTG